MNQQRKSKTFFLLYFLFDQFTFYQLPKKKKNVKLHRKMIEG